MAKRRMFSIEITDSDAFVEMPLSAQALYLHLGMHADDDGFVNGANRIQRSIGASLDDMKLLAAKKFIIPFESGVVVIKHWKMNNYIQKDRYRKTKYGEELALLDVTEDGIYHFGGQAPELGVYSMDTACIQNVHVGKVRLGKVTREEDKSSSLSGEPDEPASSDVSEIIDYLNEKTGRSFKATAAATKRMVSARRKEGYSVDDFKVVIDNKCSDWLNDPNMAMYLRPETLFCAKHFDSYLNQPRRGVPANAPSEWDDVSVEVSSQG